MSKKKPDVLTQEVTPGSTLTIGGREYKLTFPFKSVILYKEKTGDSLFDQENWKKLANPENLLAAIYAAIAPCQPEVTYDEVANLIDLSNIKLAEAALVKCLASYFPAPKPAEKGASPNGESPEAK